MPSDAFIPDPVLDVLAHAFLGDASAVETVEAWAAMHPAHRVLIEHARDVWNAAAPPPDAGDDTEAAWGAFQARVAGRRPDEA